MKRVNKCKSPESPSFNSGLAGGRLFSTELPDSARGRKFSRLPRVDHGGCCLSSVAPCLGLLGALWAQFLLTAPPRYHSCPGSLWLHYPVQAQSLILIPHILPLQETGTARPVFLLLLCVPVTYLCQAAE